MHGFYSTNIVVKKRVREREKQKIRKDAMLISIRSFSLETEKKEMNIE